MRIDRICWVELFENFGNGYPLDKVSRDYNGLIYFVGSREELTIAGHTHYLTGGTVTFLRQNETYRVVLPDNYIKCYVIDFYGETDCGYIIQHDCENMLPMFEEAARLWRLHRDDEYYEYDCMAMAWKIMAELLRRRDRSSLPLRKKERLLPVIARIHEGYGSPELKISQLSLLIGVGERCLCRIFTEVYGVSPKRYLAELRLKRAMEMLAGGCSVSETARLAGFRDVYHFSSFFKSECGFSPSEYRGGRRE